MYIRFDDLDVATGQGSIAMEIIKELPTVDYILVPIGGGGLATGVSTLAKLLNPNIKVIGVEPAGANCLQESIKAGKSRNTADSQHNRRRYSRKDTGYKVVPILTEKPRRHHHRTGRRFNRSVP